MTLGQLSTIKGNGADTSKVHQKSQDAADDQV